MSGDIQPFGEWLEGFPERPALDLRVLEERREDRHFRRRVEHTSYGETRVPVFLLTSLDGGAGGRGERGLRGVVAIHQDGNRDAMGTGVAGAVVDGVSATG